MLAQASNLAQGRKGKRSASVRRLTEGRSKQRKKALTREETRPQMDETGQEAEGHSGKERKEDEASRGAVVGLLVKPYVCR